MNRRDVLLSGGAAALAGLAGPASPAATWATPQEFGAQANGATDDSRAFAAALATGREVRVPPGTYRVDELKLPSGARLAGAGGAVLRPGRRIRIWIALADGAADVEVGGIGLDPRGMVEHAMVSSGDGFRDVRFRDVRIADAAGDPASVDATGFSFSGGKGLRLSGCSVSGVASGIVARDVSDVLVEGCGVTDWAHYGICVVGGPSRPRGVSIRQNSVTDPVVAPISDIVRRLPIRVTSRRTQGAGNAVLDAEITQNFVQGGGGWYDETRAVSNAATGDQIVMQGVEGGRIAGNLSIDGGDKGMTVSWGSRDVVVERNFVARSDSDAIVAGFDDPHYPPEVTRCANLTVRENFLLDYGQHREGDPYSARNFGVRVQNCDGYVILDNVAYMTESPPKGDSTVRLMPSSGSGTVAGSAWLAPNAPPSQYPLVVGKFGTVWSSAGGTVSTKRP